MAGGLTLLQAMLNLFLVDEEAANEDCDLTVCRRVLAVVSSSLHFGKSGEATGRTQPFWWSS